MGIFIERVGLRGAIEQLNPDSGYQDLRLYGESGIGKTSILARLSQEAPESVLVDFEQHDPGHPYAFGKMASVGASEATFHGLASLLEELVRKVEPAQVAGFRERVEELQKSEVVGRRYRTLQVAVALQSQSQAISPSGLSMLWQLASKDLWNSFVEIWNHAEKRRRLLIDNLDSSRAQSFGRWLRDLVSGQDPLPRTTRTDSDPPARLELTDVIVADECRDFEGGVEVPRFESAEIYKYLEEHLGENADGLEYDRELTSRVEEISAGHPGRLEIISNMLWPHNERDPQRESELANLPAEPHERVAELVHELVRTDESEDLWELVQTASVLRQFDAETLKVVCHAAAHPLDDWPSLYRALRDLPFVEALDERGRTFRVHSFVRRAIQTNIQALGASDLADLHQLAANYFERCAAAYQTEGSYEDAKVFENPKWQRYVREWIYHGEQVSEGQHRRDVTLELTRIFLEAFWWWGNYIRFEFCDRLVSDLSQVAEEPLLDADDAEDGPSPGSLQPALATFVDAYPPRSWKSADANWEAVRTSLGKLRSINNLTMVSGAPSKPAVSPRRTTSIGGDPEVSTADPNVIRQWRRVRVSALIDTFMAHAYRYDSNPNVDKALQHYRLARDGHRWTRMDWSLGWIDYEMAQVEFDAARTVSDARRRVDAGIHWDEARRGVLGVPDDDSERRDEGPDDDEHPDEELLANLCLLLAEAQLERRRYDEAAASFAGAIVHSYVFQMTANTMHRPDEYSMQFYVDVRAQVLRRFLDLEHSGEHAVAIELARTCADAVMTAFGNRGDVPDEERIDRLLRRLLAEAGASTELQPLAGAKDDDDAAGAPLDLAWALWPEGPDVGDIRNPPDGSFEENYYRLTSGRDLSRWYEGFTEVEWPG